MVWCFGICSNICFGDVVIFTYVYGCKYRHELSYKAPISSMGVMSLCCYDVGLPFSRVIIVNTASRYVIKLHGQYVCFSVVLLRSWRGLTLRTVFSKGGGYVTALVKIPCNKS